MPAAKQSLTALPSGMGQMRRVPIAVVGLAGLIAVPAPAAAYQRPGRTVELTVAPDGSPGAGAPESCTSTLSCGAEVAVSANGRFVAFTTDFTNLVPGDDNDEIDVFVHDRLAGTTERITADADGSSGDLSVSSDGRLVAFLSLATNLVDGPQSDGVDAFVYDRATGETIVAGIGPGAQPPDTRGINSAQLSDDGRHLAFQSNGFADDVTNDPSLPFGGVNLGNVYVRDLQTGTTDMVSLTDDGEQAAVATIFTATEVDISASGRYVVFETAREDLEPGDRNAQNDIAVRDTVTGSTEIVSVGLDGQPANYVSYNPRISADGRYVAFASLASNLVPSDTNNATTPAVGLLQGSPGTDVFVHDRHTGITRRVSLTSAGEQLQEFFRLDISGDGRFVVFDTPAANVVDEPSGFHRRTFVHDVQTGQTELVSLDETTREDFPETAFVSPPSISHDGSVVAFAGQTRTRSLDSGVYVRERGRPVDVGGLAVTQSSAATIVSGWVQLGGQTLLDETAEPAGDLPAQASGATFDRIRVTFRPEERDLLVTFGVPDMPHAALPVTGSNYLTPTAPGGIPATAHALHFGIDGVEHRLSAHRSDLGGQAAPTFVLARCEPDCQPVTELAGGYGTTGQEIVLAAPLSDMGITSGDVLADVEALAGYTDASGGFDTVSQRHQIEPTAIPDATVTVTGGGVSVVADHAAGAFSAQLPAGVPSTDILVTACVGDVCTVRSP